MKKFILIVLIAMIPFTLHAQHVPWGLSHMQFGPQYSWSSQLKSDYVGAIPTSWQDNNKAIGINGRIQTSFLDFLLYNEDTKLGSSPFRIADRLGFEAGVGYLTDRTSVSDQLSKFETTDKSIWYNVGVEVGFTAIYRIVPDIDLGLKYIYISDTNATFGATSYIRQDNGTMAGSSGKTVPAIGNRAILGGIARYKKIYVEFSHFTDNEILDIKYRYADITNSDWTPYFGFQLGIGKSISAAGGGYSSSSSFSRNWVQFSIGKMTRW